MFWLKVALGVIFLIVFLIYFALVIVFLIVEVKTVKKLQSEKFSCYNVVVGPFIFLYESISILWFIRARHFKV